MEPGADARLEGERVKMPMGGYAHEQSRLKVYKQLIVWFPNIQGWSSALMMNHQCQSAAGSPLVSMS